MANDLNIGIRLTADGKRFVGEVQVDKRDLDKLTDITRRGQIVRLNKALLSYTARHRPQAMRPVKPEVQHI